jgi:hypothetical protein
MGVTGLTNHPQRTLALELAGGERTGVVGVNLEKLESAIRILLRTRGQAVLLARATLETAEQR